MLHHQLQCYYWCLVFKILLIFKSLSLCGHVCVQASRGQKRALIRSPGTGVTVVSNPLQNSRHPYNCRPTSPNQFCLDWIWPYIFPEYVYGKVRKGNTHLKGSLRSFLRVHKYTQHSFHKASKTKRTQTARNFLYAHFKEHSTNRHINQRVILSLFMLEFLSVFEH